MKYLDDFIITNSKIYSVEYINAWLNNYSEKYKKEHDFFYKQYLYKLKDGSVVRLPPSDKITEQEKFFDLYEALDTVSKFHRDEEYFKKQIVLYNSIRESPSLLKGWITKNQEFGTNKYITFLIDYLDYDEHEKIKDLNIYVPSLKNVDIYVARQEFKYTIEFIETFNELYWLKGLNSESFL